MKLLKKLWEMIKGLFKKTVEKNLPLLLDLGIEYFMRYYNSKITDKISGLELLMKLEASILKKIDDTDNKFDDFFKPFIVDGFQRIDPKLVDKWLDNSKDMIPTALNKIKEMIILKYESWENKQ